MMRGQTPKILVIDDDRTVVDILTTCLREEGYGVFGALTAEDGLRLFLLARPDLVLLDLTLPGVMNGIEVLKQVRSIPVIMISGNSDPNLVRHAYELGALAFIGKPFDLTYLTRIVSKALTHEA